MHTKNLSSRSLALPSTFGSFGGHIGGVRGTQSVGHAPAGAAGRLVGEGVVGAIVSWVLDRDVKQSAQLQRPKGDVMAHEHLLDHGAVITFLDPDVSAPSAFGRGIVVGPVLVDPFTERAWVPVLRPDRSTLVLNIANIVEVVARNGTRGEPGPA
ncbi:hypothetical protein ACRAKI_21100 [Saccharothrix isguenensis]